MVNHRRAAFYILILGILLVSCSSATPEIAGPEPTFDSERLLEFTTGQLPGSVPEPFGIGWFSGGFHSAPVFSPDGLAFWWAGSYSSQKVYVSRFEDGSWSEQEHVSFSDEILFYRDPFISPDGLKFYFISTSSLPGSGWTGKENLWMMEWEAEGWGEPQPLPESINNLNLHWTPSVASNYDLYFSARTDGYPDIYKSEYVDGTYQDPHPLGGSVNTEALELTPHIAPDQSYILFSRAGDSDHPARLYVSYAVEDEWSKAVLVENVEECISPILTPDGNYVIYLKDPSQLEWRDTSFIEELRPK
jgi:Tol biopolymer transport system component